tara:strand:+ start:605 stop:772 length:168 start_codon:yes stop_codon:yes gene_type:complete
MNYKPSIFDGFFYALFFNISKSYKHEIVFVCLILKFELLELRNIHNLMENQIKLL